VLTDRRAGVCFPQFPGAASGWLFPRVRSRKWVRTHFQVPAHGPLYAAITSSVLTPYYLATVYVVRLDGTSGATCLDTLLAVSISQSGGRMAEKKESVEATVRTICRVTREKYSAEEKVRIVL
jgi:hypothetical protein